MNLSTDKPAHVHPHTFAVAAVSRRVSLAKSLGDCLADDAKHASFDGAPVSQIRAVTPIG
jgi:hypothetical protein